jgi:hypothetical protein
LFYQGKNVAHSTGKNWKAVGLNPAQTVVRQLSSGAKAFPCFAAQLCKTRRAPVFSDLSSHNYLSQSQDYSNLADLTQEIFARLNESVSAIWLETEANPEISVLYGGYPLEQRERWAFGSGGSTVPAPQILGTREKQQIEVANEVWARAITELVCFSPYYGPGPGYFDGDIRTVEHDDDGDVTVEIRSRVEYDLAEGVSGSPRRGTDAFYPIVNACQHLTTLAVLSRGWCLSASSKRRDETLLETESSLTAGSQGAVTYTTMLKDSSGSTLPCTWAPGGSTAGSTPPRAAGDTLVEWLGNDSVKASPNAAALIALRGSNGTGFGPGSIALFTNRSMSGYQPYTLSSPPRSVARSPTQVAEHEAYLQWRAQNPTGKPPPGMRVAPPDEWGYFPRHLADNTAGAHIGTILRVDPTGNRFQVLDTGALNTGATSDVWPGLSGVHDYLGTAGTMSGSDPYRGVGLPPLLTEANARALYDHAKGVIDQARPLGLMRLIIARRGPDLLATNLGEWLLYASPLMRMYGDGTTPGDRATLANLVWSLRDFPKRTEVRVIWSIRLPVGPLARAMLAEGRRTHTFNLAGRVMRDMLDVAAANPRSQVARDRVRLYVNGDDVATEPRGAEVAPRRAWLIRQGFGAPTLACARILSRFSRLALDLESNADGTVSTICSLNAHGPQGYSGSIPRFHDAEISYIERARQTDAMLALPLHCGTGAMPTPTGAWQATPEGFSDWTAQMNALTQFGVARSLLERFL